MERRRLYNKQLSKADEKELGRLVKKYGRPRIAEWALTVRMPRMGKPAKGKPEVEAHAIQLGIGHFEGRGSNRPFIEVARIVYREEKGGREDDEGWEKWLAAFKRRFLRNRKKLMEQLEQDGLIIGDV